jgi:hypothetical protein
MCEERVFDVGTDEADNLGASSWPEILERLAITGRVIDPIRAGCDHLRRCVTDRRNR